MLTCSLLIVDIGVLLCLEGGGRAVEWLNYLAVVQEVLGSNPGAAESVGSDGIICKYLPL